MQTNNVAQGLDNDPVYSVLNNTCYTDPPPPVLPPTLPTSTRPPYYEEIDSDFRATTSAAATEYEQPSQKLTDTKPLHGKTTQWNP